jgi:dTDP-4-amino-4,6-dideoxygalactose transaminase
MAEAITQTLVPFNRTSITAIEHEYVASVLKSGQLRAGGTFTNRCHDWLAGRLRPSAVLLTTSATAALEMALILANVAPGDEVIMPAFTFASCASAVARCGATPVFVDIEPDTLNIDVNAVAAAVGPRTKAIVPVHYAGILYDVESLASLAGEYGLFVAEDAAHAITSTYQEKEAGSFGHVGFFSFHHTKNLSCGEGGALIINDRDYAARAQVVLHYGTNYVAFHQGRVPNYTWLDVGGSFMPSDLTAALLLAQLERADEIMAQRRALWCRYHAAFAPLERLGVRRPTVRPGVRHNGHIYYLLLPAGVERQLFEAAMRRSGIDTRSHYVPLDSTLGGRRFGRAGGELNVTHSAAARLVRLPLWPGMGELHDRVIEAVMTEFGC